MNNETIVNNITNIYGDPSLEIYILLGGLVVSIGLLVISILTLRQSNKIQRNNMFHDLVKMQRIVMDDLERIGGRTGIERVLNFYEYLSFLYFQNLTNKEMTKKLFKYELIQSYEKFRRHIKSEFDNLKNLYGRWKDEKIN